MAKNKSNKKAVKPAPKKAAKPVKKAAKPAPKKAAKPAKKAAKPAPKKAVKPVAKKAAKPVAKKAAPKKPVAKAKPVAKKAAKPVAKKAAPKKPVAKAKPVAKKAAKPVAKKPVAKAKPVAKKAAAPVKKAPAKLVVKKAAEPVKPAAKPVVNKVVEKPQPVKKEAEKPVAKPMSKPEAKPASPRAEKKQSAPKAESMFKKTVDVKSLPKPPVPVGKPTSMFYGQPKASDLTKANKVDERTRYSDEELKEFKDIIHGKLAEARKDLDLLRSSLTHTSDNGTDDTSPTFKMMEDGSETLSREETAQLAGRQEKFIQALEAALIRIQNKTYGVCRVTGRLINKERLKLVPHTTLSIEAKNLQN